MMSLLKTVPSRLVKALIHTCGYGISRSERQLMVYHRQSALGVEPLADIGRLLRNRRPVILDIGSNRGQSAVAFREAFPKSTIYCFEPSPALLEELSTAVKRDGNVHVEGAAVGDVQGVVQFNVNSISEMSSILSLGPDGWGEILDTVSVPQVTIDGFCERHGIESVDVLKVDTQGYDLKVLRGAERYLSDGRINMILSEFIFNDMYAGEGSYINQMELLASKGFELVTFYRMAYQRGVASWIDGLYVRKGYLAGL